jgi:glycerophosphoryl diester phosphodiesterase
VIVLSHRGYWKEGAEKNTAGAFARSFHLGFGTETDLRDLDGQLVIAHDPARSGALAAEVLFEIHRAIDPTLPLALNVKADGLQRWVKGALERYGLERAFVFDMSVPDARGYLAAGVPVFTRQSELECEPAFYGAAAGVWVDGFESDWATERDLARHLGAGKRVCVVSPELHKRPHEAFWERLAGMGCAADPRLMLCTDLPEDAREVFCA